MVGGLTASTTGYFSGLLSTNGEYGTTCYYNSTGGFAGGITGSTGYFSGSFSTSNLIGTVQTLRRFYETSTLSSS